MTRSSAAVLARILLLFFAVIVRLNAAEPAINSNLFIQAAVVLSFQTEPGALYRLEAASDLGAAWTPVGDVVFGNGGIHQAPVVSESQRHGLFRLRQLVTTNGLVAYYPFNGNSLDASGLGNHAIVQGATLSTNRFGVESSSYRLFETGHVIRASSTIGFPEGTNDFTMSLWTHWERRVFSEQVLFANRLTNQFQLTISPLGHNYARLQLFLGGGPQPDVASQSFLWAPLAWHLIQVVRSGETVFIYFDNRLVGQSKELAGVYFVKTALDFGSRSSHGNGQFFGDLDDIRIYNRALSVAELEALGRLREP